MATRTFVIQMLKYGFPFLALFIWSCNPKQEQIMYGFDACVHCKMTITDYRYGTEVVTKKGKVFKFDSIECMVGYVSEKMEDNQISMMFVTDYESHKLIPVNSASFLFSEGLPSPMGMYLTAFSNFASAEVFQSELGGEIVDMEKIAELIYKQ
jgi:copper chaperone NosL